MSDDKHEVRSVLCAKCSTVYVSAGGECPRCERDDLRGALAKAEAALAAVNEKRDADVLDAARKASNLKQEIIDRIRADLAAARAEVERLTRERDEALAIKTDELKAKFEPMVLPLLTKAMNETTDEIADDLDDKYRAFAEKGYRRAIKAERELASAISREAKMRGSLAELVEAMRRWGAEEDGIPEKLGWFKPFAAWEHARALLSDVALSTPSPSCPSRPRRIVLCGSTKFKAAYGEWNARLTLEGNVVLSVAMWSHGAKVEPTPEQKAILDAVHLAKIDASDEVFVLDVGGYIGESTRNEIRHAEATGKPVRYLSREYPEWTEADCRWWKSPSCPSCERLRGILRRAHDTIGDQIADGYLYNDDESWSGWLSEAEAAIREGKP